MKGLFIKSKSGNKYFYNDSTGFIDPIVDGWSEEEFVKKYKKIIDSSAPVKKEQVTEEKLLKYLFDEAQGFKQLVLETTSSCNLRCKYCIYSDQYPTYKTYENKYMSFDLAKKAVDLYLKNFKRVQYRNPSRTATIGFYGGEPLLNFKLIKQVVNYIKEEYTEKVSFNLTTNGLLFLGEVQDFLAKNDFCIIVSLDGNEENHDRNRVKINGEGSFSEVMNNIGSFRKNHPDYGKFALSACYDLKSDLLEYEKFINDENLFLAKLALIEASNTTYYNQFTQNDIDKFNENNEILGRKFYTAAKEGKVEKNSFLYSYIGLNYSQFAFHSVYNEKRPAILPYTGACIPGEKLYVTIDGNIHMCEKINSNYPIGNISDGLNYNEIINIINRYNDVVTRKCNECNVTRFCNLCYSQCSTCSNEFNNSDNVCKNIETNTINTLVKYVNLLEIRPDLFEDVTVEYFGQIYEKAGERIEL
ncbi:radical SAM protein [Clostridium estertheticum]|uniref:radical SAM protein n=1 Tax=Clostridium estertheticum TaxID=238834 RepID=UPI001CF35F19|nr:radical SAM protein [Clostridium estertheticum]MCB2362189.1 4Fe-4S cluster-binding domain-containing protein [Clostridium estertheticum]